MEIAKWGEPFRLDTLYDGWDEAPKKAGVYVVYTGKTIQRAGGPDKKGILYIGKSLVLRNRLYNFWYVQHPASGLLWTYPKLTQLILNVTCKSKKQVEDLLGAFKAVAYGVRLRYLVIEWSPFFSNLPLWRGNQEFTFRWDFIT